MARVTVKVPKLGDTADEVVVLGWYVRAGDTVTPDMPLLHVETAKVEVDIPCPVGGVMLEQLVSPEDEVSVGAPLCVIET